MTTANNSRCEHCGTSLRETNYSEKDAAWVCLGCFFKGDGPALTPIEPLRPLEPAKSLSTLITDDGSMGVQGSKGVPDGSVGVDQTAARVKALGINTPLRETFGCVLPGHTDKARVHSTSRKFWRYECATSSLGLAEVRACVGYGTVKRISQLEAARWRERLDYEAGLLEPRPVEVSVSDSSASSTLRVAGGLRLFLGLRDERWEGQPFTWARQFVMAWCGVSDQQAREAVWQLRQAGVLVPTGEKPPPRVPVLYRIGGAA